VPDPRPLDPQLVDLTVAQLERNGYEVTLTRNASGQVVRIAGSRRPDRAAASVDAAVAAVREWAPPRPHLSLVHNHLSPQAGEDQDLELTDDEADSARPRRVHLDQWVDGRPSS